MAFEIDCEVRGCHIHKDVWSAGIDFELPCMHALQSLQSRRPHAPPDTLKSSGVLLLIFVAGIIFSKRKASSKYTVYTNITSDSVLKGLVHIHYIIANLLNIHQHFSIN